MATIIKIAAGANGAHANQSGAGFTEAPEGYVLVPPELEGAARGYLPFIDLEVVDGVLVGVSQGSRIGEPHVRPEARYTPRDKDDFLAGLMEGLGV